MGRSAPPIQELKFIPQNTIENRNILRRLKIKIQDFKKIPKSQVRHTPVGIR
jgi:hypothetical protein